MPSETWFDNYCRKIELLWRDQFYNVHQYADSDIRIEYAPFKPGHVGSIYEYRDIRNSVSMLNTTDIPDDFQHAAALLHSRYNTASSSLLELLGNFEDDIHFLRSESYYSKLCCAMDSLFVYFFNAKICDKNKLKSDLKNDIHFDAEERTGKNAIKALNNGFVSYMKGVYDSWYKAKEKKFTNACFNGLNEIKEFKKLLQIRPSSKSPSYTIQLPWGPMMISSNPMEIYNDIQMINGIGYSHYQHLRSRLVVGFDKAAFVEKDINNRLKEVAKYEFNEPLISTPKHRRSEKMAVASAVNYLKNLGVVDKGEAVTPIKYGLTAALKGSADRWFEEETIRNMGELYKA